MLVIIIKIYIVCCVLGLAFSLMGMNWASESRKLDRNDLIAAIFFTASGFIGTGVIIYLLIPEIIKKWKEAKAKKEKS